MCLSQASPTLANFGLAVSLRVFIRKLRIHRDQGVVLMPFAIETGAAHFLHFTFVDNTPARAKGAGLGFRDSDFFGNVNPFESLPSWPLFNLPSVLIT